MANRALLLCLLIVCSSIYVSGGKWGSSGGRSSSSSSRRGGSSWGKGWGGGSSSSGGSSSWSSGSSYKPSSSSGSSWSSGSSYKPSYSWNTGSSSSSGSSWSKPSTFDFQVPKIPSSGGSSSSGSHNYPSSTGLSGSSSGSHKYPSSSTGLSGSSSGSHSYPSGTGLSGSGSGSHYGTGSHGYPSSTGLSGSNKPIYSAPPHTWHTSSSSSGSTYYQPPIIHYPQNVYVTQYKDSGSRYGDLLTGLTLYNMGRSHSHYYHDHYYYDDYYRHRYYDNYNSNSGGSYRPSTEDRPKDEAVCNLRIVENGKVQLLKIPCEIVSTFTEGGKKVNAAVETTFNTTVCTSNSTVTTKKPEDLTNNTSAPTSAVNAVNMTSVANATAPVRIENNVTEGNKTIHTVRVITSSEEIVNVTVCITNTTLKTTDPLKVKGAPIDPSKMECSVDIKTKDTYFRNPIDCNTLMQYAKKPLTSPKQNSIMPERQKLKKWLEKPPWWMSMFIAV